MRIIAGVLEPTSGRASLDGEDIVYIARASTNRIMTIGLSVGTRLPAYCTSMGRVLLASLDPDALAGQLGLADTIVDAASRARSVARFREQACTFICPYGRFQSAMLDENTMVVAYDHKRGEKRASK